MIRAGLDRLLERLRPAAPSPAPVAAPPAPPPARAERPEKPEKPPGTVLVTALGLEGEALARVVEMTARECRAKRVRLVVVIDRDDFAPFRGRRVSVEQVVDAEACAVRAPDLAWQLHRRRQFKLLHERWKPATIATFGRKPDQDCMDALKGAD